MRFISNDIDTTPCEENIDTKKRLEEIDDDDMVMMIIMMMITEFYTIVNINIFCTILHCSGQGRVVATRVVSQGTAPVSVS